MLKQGKKVTALEKPSILYNKMVDIYKGEYGQAMVK